MPKIEIREVPWDFSRTPRSQATPRTLIGSKSKWLSWEVERNRSAHVGLCSLKNILQASRASISKSCHICSQRPYTSQIYSTCPCIQPHSLSVDHSSLGGAEPLHTSLFYSSQTLSNHLLSHIPQSVTPDKTYLTKSLSRLFTDSIFILRRPCLWLRRA